MEPKFEILLTDLWFLRAKRKSAQSRELNWCDLQKTFYYLLLKLIEAEVF
jgi:hypothetical protein